MPQSEIIRVEYNPRPGGGCNFERSEIVAACPIRVHLSTPRLQDGPIQLNDGIFRSVHL